MIPTTRALYDTNQRRNVTNVKNAPCVNALNGRACFLTAYFNYCNNLYRVLYGTNFFQLPVLCLFEGSKNVQKAPASMSTHLFCADPLCVEPSLPQRPAAGLPTVAGRSACRSSSERSSDKEESQTDLLTPAIQRTSQGTAPRSTRVPRDARTKNLQECSREAEDMQPQGDVCKVSTRHRPSNGKRKSQSTKHSRPRPSTHSLSRVDSARRTDGHCQDAAHRRGVTARNNAPQEADSEGRRKQRRPRPRLMRSVNPAYAARRIHAEKREPPRARRAALSSLEAHTKRNMCKNRMK